MTESVLIDRLRPGDHVGWVFDDDLGRDRACAAYLRDATRNRHKVLFLTDDVTPERTLARMTEQGVAVDAMLRDGSLEVLVAAQGYLAGGRFDAEAVIDGWGAACAQSRSEGFAGLRALGDATWATRPIPGSERLDWYEARVNQVFADGYAMALCLYDRRRFDPARLSDVLRAHPATVDLVTDPQTGPGWDPLLRVRWSDGGNAVRLVGEADLSNRDCLQAVLDILHDRVGGSSRPTVDASGLRFADVGAARSLVASAARTGGLRVVGARAGLTELLGFVGGDRVPGLVVEQA